jgi:signal transduction histidine kinase
MGRLFWKIFLVILLAQVVTANVVGTLLWLHNPRQEFRPPSAREDGPPRRFDPEQPWLAGPPPPPQGGRPGPHGFPWMPVVVGSIASLIFAALLARYLSRPIMALRKAFAAVAKGNFDVHPSQEIGKRSDELAELGQNFEHTARQLKQAMASQRRLLHDVSHEVRSPLARMQLAIDLARQQPERTEHSMQRIERESARIDRLVEELLTLSRLEARSVGALDETVNVSELLDDIVADARFEAEPSNRKIEFLTTCEAQVKSREELLQRAIENVVRNALRHTFENTVVQVSLRIENDCVRIDVEDDGPGLPDAALGAIFEPFVRFREDHGNDGYGLGLAITRQTIEAHGGSVCATNRETGGLRIELRIPTICPDKPA